LTLERVLHNSSSSLTRTPGPCRVCTTFISPWCERVLCHFQCTSGEQLGLWESLLLQFAVTHCWLKKKYLTIQCDGGSLKILTPSRCSFPCFFLVKIRSCHIWYLLLHFVAFSFQPYIQYIGINLKSAYWYSHHWTMLLVLKKGSGFQTLHCTVLTSVTHTILLPSWLKGYSK
jgi:hypothetical protein